MKATDGGPAFPQHGWSSDQETLERMQASGMGMSLRDYFAAKAMQAIVTATCGEFEGTQATFEACMALTASQSFSIADAMLKAREPKPSPSIDSQINHLVEKACKGGEAK